MQVCESLAVSAGAQEKGAIGAMFEREMKQEKNLEVRRFRSFFLLTTHTLKLVRSAISKIIYRDHGYNKYLTLYPARTDENPCKTTL